MFSGPFDESIVKRAIDQGLVSIDFVDIRDFGIGTHKSVDDTPYGGGQGMVLRVDVLQAAIDSVKKSSDEHKTKVFLLDAAGESFNQQKAVELSKLDHLILICGHYEGVDARIENYIDGKISIGNFVTTGGELPAMLVVDSVARLVKGVLKEGVTDNESHSESLEGRLEYPQYTKPDIFEGQQVPQVLKSGDHKKIEVWKKSNLQSRS